MVVEDESVDLQDESVEIEDNSVVEEEDKEKDKEDNPDDDDVSQEIRVGQKVLVTCYNQQTKS